MNKAILAILILCTSIGAYADRSFEGPISAAMGGSGRASVLPGELNLNPASLSFLLGYQAVATYRNFALDPFGNIADFKVSVSDNHSENIFPASIVYAKHRTWENNIGTNEEEIHLSIAKFYWQRLSLGFDIQRFTLTPDIGAVTTEWDPTFGAIYLFTPEWGAGVVAQNFLPTNSVSLISKFGLATTYNFGSVIRFQLDLLYPAEMNPNRKWVYMGGFESHLIKDVGIRAGLRVNDVDLQNYWTLGIGWIGPKISLDYALEKNTQKASEIAHSVDLRVYF